jgi:hypothetical protein
MGVDMALPGERRGKKEEGSAGRKKETLSIYSYIIVALEV